MINAPPSEVLHSIGIPTWRPNSCPTTHQDILQTGHLMRLLTTVMKRGTIEATLNICDYLQNIPREAKRLRLITAPPAHHLDGLIKTPHLEPPLSRLPVQFACIERTTEAARSRASW